MSELYLSTIVFVMSVLGGEEPFPDSLVKTDNCFRKWQK